MLTNRRNVYHRPALLWCFRDFGAEYKTADLLTLKRQNQMKQEYYRIVRLQWLLNPTLLMVMMVVVVTMLPTLLLTIV